MKKTYLVLAVAGLLSSCAKSTDVDGLNTCGSDMKGVEGSENSVMQNDFCSSVQDRVHFSFDKSVLTNEAKKVLETQAAWLRTYPNTKAMIAGHCDERGLREYNLALGERRAHASFNYLTALGVEASRLSTISYGKERPIVEGNTEEAYAQNRVAITHVVDEQGVEEHA
jgi:peptidoglycan-associated lipoprotein